MGPAIAGLRSIEGFARWATAAALFTAATMLALLIVGGTSPTACDQLPRAFNPGVTTETSATFGGYVAAHCEYTVRATGEVVRATVVNWSGLIIGGFGWIAAVLTCASIVLLVDWRRALPVAAVSLLVSFVALVEFFA
jgi:hypothetical protein